MCVTVCVCVCVCVCGGQSDLASTACVMPPLSPNYMYVQYCWVLIVLMLFTFVAAIYGFITRPDAVSSTASIRKHF